MAQPSDPQPQDEPADADARFRHGLQLLGQATTFARAVALIESAASFGHAEALGMVATLEAVGADRPRNWNRALEYLARAAERGLAHARAQLDVLARMRGSDGVDPNETSDPIGLGSLLCAPEPVALSDRPRLRVFRRFANEAECRWLIERFQARLHRAVVWDADSGKDEIDPYRTNKSTELPLAETDVVVALLKARIAAATRLPEFLFEVPQLMHYAVGEEFKPHHDFLDPDKPGFAADLARRGQRMGTFLIFLNDDFEGGETVFPKAGIAFRGRTGDALFFANVTRDGRPDPLTLHAGRAPVSGEKWILSQWIRDRAPQGA
jgi:hypothetical protein